MKHEIRLFFIALQFLTRVPVPAWVGYEPAWLQAGARHFPAVGACVGAFAAAVLWLALWLFPPAVAVALSMVASIWLTGGFHEDGLADTCDGLGGAVSRQRALEIMKDSRIGAYGTMGLVLALLLKAATLTALVDADFDLHDAAPLGALCAIVWAHAASRLAPVLLIRWMTYAGDPEHAKAKPFATQIGARGLLASGLWVALLSLGVMALTPSIGAAHGLAVLVALLAALATTALAARWLRRRLGGYTGDTLGATQQVVEIVILLAWLAMLG